MPDSSFDHALRAAARRGRQGDVCPGAEQLAAFADRSLGAAERERVEAHAADCLRCTEHLALLAAVSTGDAARADGRSWLARWGWLVPVATAVLVVAVWVRMPDVRTSPPAAPAATDRFEAAEPPREAPAMPGEDLPAAEAIATPPLGESSSAPVPPSAAGKPESDASGKMAPAGDGRRLEGAGGSGAENADPRARETTAPEVRSARPQARKEAAVPLALKDDATREDKDDQKTRLTRAPSSDVSAPARPPAPAAAAPPAEAQADALSETKKATAPRTSRTAQPQSGPAAQTQYKAEMAIVPFEVRASAQRRYRGIGGVLQQSDDAGVTWRDVLSNTGVTFTSGACASPDACWFGATGGVVLFRSSTGTRRFVLPVTSDVARVTATSADAAEVTLATGERFRTVDGGREWTRVP